MLSQRHERGIHVVSVRWMGWRTWDHWSQECIGNPEEPGVTGRVHAVRDDQLQPSLSCVVSGTPVIRSGTGGARVTEIRFLALAAAAGTTCKAAWRGSDGMSAASTAAASSIAASRIAARARRRPGPRSGCRRGTHGQPWRPGRPLSYADRTIYHIEALQLYPVKRQIKLAVR